MAYDRHDTRDAPRDERPRWRDDRGSDDRFADRERAWRGDDRGRGGREDRGFFERAGDEVASWFGDEDAERRRREDQMRDQRGETRDHDRGYRSTGDERSAFSSGAGNDRNRDWDRDRSSARHENWNENRGMFARGGSSNRDYNPRWRDEFSGQGHRIEPNDERDRWVERNNRDFGRRSSENGRGAGDYGRSSGRETFGDRDDYRRDQDFDRNRGQGSSRDYRPLTGDYGRSSDFDRGSRSNWARDEYRETSRAGTANKSDRSREDRFDPHYRSWRDRHMSELDRDYDDYRAENQSRFESDFGGWRERRQQKRGLLGQVREHMEVVGSDDKHVGTVDKTAGDRLILTKSDPESGGIHHSISCADIDRIAGDKVILDCSADQAHERWRDESRGRALFEPDDQGEMGPRMLDRSFEGTYR